MLLQTNSYIVPREKRAEHARLIRRFRQTLLRLGCDQFEVYEQVGQNWSPAGDGHGRYVQIMRFRDRRQQQAVQAAERDDPAAQQLIAEFCDLINLPYQQQNGYFAVGYYTGALPTSPRPVIEYADDAEAADAAPALESSEAGEAAEGYESAEVAEGYEAAEVTEETYGEAVQEEALEQPEDVAADQADLNEPESASPSAALPIADQVAEGEAEPADETAPVEEAAPVDEAAPAGEVQLVDEALPTDEALPANENLHVDDAEETPSGELTPLHEQIAAYEEIPAGGVPDVPPVDEHVGGEALELNSEAPVEPSVSAADAGALDDDGPLPPGVPVGEIPATSDFPEPPDSIAPVQDRGAPFDAMDAALGDLDAPLGNTELPLGDLDTPLGQIDALDVAESLDFEQTMQAADAIDAAEVMHASRIADAPVVHEVGGDADAIDELLATLSGPDSGMPSLLSEPGAESPAARLMAADEIAPDTVEPIGAAESLLQFSEELADSPDDLPESLDELPETVDAAAELPESLDEIEETEQALESLEDAPEELESAESPTDADELAVAEDAETPEESDTSEQIFDGVDPSAAFAEVAISMPLISTGMEDVVTADQVFGPPPEDVPLEAPHIQAMNDLVTRSDVQAQPLGHDPQLQYMELPATLEAGSEQEQEERRRLMLQGHALPDLLDRALTDDAAFEELLRREEEAANSRPETLPSRE